VDRVRLDSGLHGFSERQRLPRRADLTRAIGSDPVITCYFLVSILRDPNFIDQFSFRISVLICSGFIAVSHLLTPASAIKTDGPLASLSRKPTTGQLPEGYKLRHPAICSSLVAVVDLGRDNLSLVENIEDQFNVKSYIVSMFPGVDRQSRSGE
jgi:hypothetical protein